MKKTDKHLDWNSAFQGNEDWKAALDSEVFRGYLSRYISKEAAEQQEEKEKAEKELKEKLNKDHEMIMDKVKQSFMVDYDEMRRQLKELIAQENVVFEVTEEPAKEECCEDLYHTNAGESPHIDIGLTQETMNSMNDTAVCGKSTSKCCEPVNECCEQPDTSESIKDATKEVMDIYHQEEIADAEKTLGLDTNIAYLISNLKVQG